MQRPIIDPHFRVTVDYNASSPAPTHGIWTAQHVCVSDLFAPDADIPIMPSDAIIKHQLGVKHWSVLEFGFVVLHFGGFPHDTVMQLVRHQDSKPLVQSMRYTGERMMNITADNVEELFYAQPVGEYVTRDGRYVIQEHTRNQYLNDCYLSARRYNQLIKINGWPEELARRSLISGYRQNFAMAGSIRAVMHWLDQRTLADSQIEAQTLAWMALEQLKVWCPRLFEWYERNRAGKNLLAP